MSRRAALSAMAASIIMAAVVSTATAGRFSTSNQNIRAVWRELILIAEPLENTCEVTLEGSFHSRTIPKTVGTLLGYITRTEVARCSLTTRFGLNLPWHVRYRSFRGTLPNITSVRLDLIDMSFLICAPFSAACCLFRSTAARPWLLELIRNAAGVITGIRSDETAGIPLFQRLSGVVNCPTEFFWTGTGTFALLGTTTPITITLI